MHVKHKTLLHENQSDENWMDMNFKKINDRYLNPLKATVERKILIPERKKWKLVSWGQLIKVTALCLGLLVTFPVVIFILIFKSYIVEQLCTSVKL